MILSIIYIVLAILGLGLIIFLHELGHYFLHSKMGEIPLCINRDTSTSSLLEWQANWFAGAFLMPANVVRDLRAKGLSCTDSADYFRVSEMAMKVRWKTLDLK